MKWLFLCWLLIVPAVGRCQGENNIWTFYPVVHDIALDFNQSPPVVINLPVTSGLEGFSIAVCRPNGQLRFYVRLRDNTASSSENCIFAANGSPVPGSNLYTGVLTDACMPVVVPRPGNADQYYIFYSNSNGLLYSLLDMNLNNGAGGIVSGEKDIVLSPFGTVVAQKMTAVKGCNGVWIVVRSRVANQYYSFQVTAGGVSPNAVVSQTGNFTLYDYNFSSHGFLKASQDGSRIAICGWAGVELYDFEKCSGKLQNARVIDTTGNGVFTVQNMNNHTRFQDVCFSPDGSKLYACQNYQDPVSNSADVVLPGKLFQFDLSLSSLSDIIASKQLLLVNYPSLFPNITLLCDAIAQNPMGCIKAGPDGKLYIDNGSFTCLPPSMVPPGYNPGPAFHVVNNPNAAGLSCLPQSNLIVVNSYTNNLGGDFHRSGFGGQSYLQQDIVVAPLPPDTLPGYVSYPVGCFKDSMVLAADSAGSCYLWDDGSTASQRVIYHSGTYYVSYFRDCSYQTDTFHAVLTGLPSVVAANPSCPGMYMGMLAASVSTHDTASFNYTWKTIDGSILAHHSAGNADTLSGLDTGTYFVRITTSSGCDTTLSAIVAALPKPQVVAWPVDTTIRYGDSIRLNASGAMLYVWLPSGPLDTATKANPMARPLQPLVFSVIGLNSHGCSDTGYVRVNIDYNMADLVPNAFSPNGDGLNDAFRIEGISYQKIGLFSVYNRFGQEIFSTIDAHKGWDGTKQGRPCDAGTYYYLVELHYPDGKTKTLKGDITLIR